MERMPKFAAEALKEGDAFDAVIDEIAQMIEEKLVEREDVLKHLDAAIAYFDAKGSMPEAKNIARNFGIGLAVVSIMAMIISLLARQPVPVDVGSTAAVAVGLADDEEHDQKKAARERLVQARAKLAGA